MGEFAEAMVEYYSNPDPFRGTAYDRETIREVFSDPIWYQTKHHKPKEGQLILLTDMNPSWRGNCIRLWQRRVTTEQGKRDLMRLPLVKKMIELGAGGFPNQR